MTNEQIGWLSFLQSSTTEKTSQSSFLESPSNGHPESCHAPVVNAVSPEPTNASVAPAAHKQMRLGREAVKKLGKAESIERVRKSLRNSRPTFPLTVWFGGVNRTFGGKPDSPGKGKQLDAPFIDQAEEHLGYANDRVFPKGEGWRIAYGESLYRGSTDDECKSIQGVMYDADKAGGYQALALALCEIGVAFQLQETGGSTPADPRFHLLFPLAIPLVPTESISSWKKSYYEPAYLFIAGILAEIGELEDSKNCPGFDASTTRLLTPWEIGCRRKEGAETPTTIYSDGKWLDWEQLLKEFGYEPPKLSSPAPAIPTAKGGAAVAPKPQPHGDIIDLPLVRAFSAANWLINVEPGRAFVKCPWSEEHTSGQDGDGGTVILPGRGIGAFKCSHSHCAGRKTKQAEQMLPPDARRPIYEARSHAGVQRLRAQLAARDIGQEKRWDEVAPEIADILAAAAPDAVTVVVVTAGAGKTRGAQLEVIKRGRGVFAVRSHDLAQQVVKVLSDANVDVEHRMGVTRKVDQEGKTICKYPGLAERVQEHGGSVPRLLCSRCQYKNECPARAPGKSGQDHVVVAPHQLLPINRVKGDTRLVIVDEGPVLVEHRFYTMADLVAAEQFLSGKGSDVLAPTYRQAMRAWIGVLVATKGGTLPLGHAAWEYHKSHSLLIDDLKTICDGPISKILNAIRLAGDLYGEDEWTPFFSIDDVEKATAATQAALSLRPLLRLGRRTQPGQLLTWDNNGALVFEELNAVGEDLRRHGAVLLDATPDISELTYVAGKDRLKVHTIDVKDGAKVERSVIYTARAARRQLMPGGEPDWNRYGRFCREVVARAESVGATKILLATYKSVATRWTEGNSPCEEQFAAWRAKGNLIDFVWYGGTNGLNKWSGFNCSATIGDPWPNRDEHRRRARLFGVPENEYQRAFAARELEQVHGRLRAPSRKEPAWMFHFGAVAPIGWNDKTARVVVEARGRRENVSACTDAEAHALVETLISKCGSASAAARAIGVDRRQLGRYLSGETKLPEPVRRRIIGYLER